jgi:hypothetical protein
MTGSAKGAIAGLLAGTAITIAWAVAATGREGDCLAAGPDWPDGCQCDPVTANTLALVGVFAIMPCAFMVGSVLGRFAERLHDYRRTVLATIAASLAGLLVGIADLFRHCSTDPQPSALLIRALVPAVVAALLLEAVTRNEPAIARARIN